MKSPLRYQATEYDCGPTTMTNAIMFLFDREEIPPDLIRHIGQCTLDSFDDKGHCGRYGTSGAAMRYFGVWLNELRYAGLLPIESRYAEKQDVFFGETSLLTTELNKGSAIVLRVFLHGSGHYILITGHSGKTYQVFDPYFAAEEKSSEQISSVSGDLYSCNLEISEDLLNALSEEDYAMGNLSQREALIINRYRIDDLYVI